MCDFFSLVSDGKGKIYYFDSKIRKDILSGKSKYEKTDSHTSIADYFGFKGKKEDQLNKYEYNPLTGKFTVDQINTQNDQQFVEQFCRKLDFHAIVPELIIKPIINPFDDRNCEQVTEKHIELLKEWVRVRENVCGIVAKSVRENVGDIVWTSVWKSVRERVGYYSVCGIVAERVREIEKCIEWPEAWMLLWDSMLAYMSSFFNIEKVNPFQSCIDLWEAGLVPSYDGKVWRLHGGKDGKILWEGKE